jgi:hypothetical protein
MDWKGMLASIAGLLMLILQVINVFLSNDIDIVLGQKSILMEQKAAQLTALVDAKTELFKDRSDAIQHQMEENTKRLQEAQKALRETIPLPIPSRSP